MTAANMVVTIYTAADVIIRQLMKRNHPLFLLASIHLSQFQQALDDAHH